MLTVTAISNRVFLSKIGAAMAEAARNAADWFPSAGAAYIANRHGRPVLRVTYLQGAGFEFYAGNRCLTPTVRTALASHGRTQDCPLITTGQGA